MYTVTVRSHVGPDGVLHLDIPSQYRDTELDITIVVRPAHSDVQNGMQTKWPEGFFENVIGGWKGEPLKREHGGPYEVREEL